MAGVARRAPPEPMARPVPPVLTERKGLRAGPQPANRSPLPHGCLLSTATDQAADQSNRAPHPNLRALLLIVRFLIVRV